MLASWCVVLASCDGPASGPHSGPAPWLSSLSAAGYDAETSPTHAGVTPEGEPTLVQAHATLISLVSVNAPSQTVTLAMWIRYIWIDQRLAWNSSCVPWSEDEIVVRGSPEHRVWVPSVFGENVRETPKRIEGGWWLRNDGQVWWSRKEYWTLMCDMDFTLMPFDKQECFIRLTTYSDDNSTVVMAATAGRDAINLAPDAYSMEGDVEWRFITEEDHAHREYSEVMPSLAVHWPAPCRPHTLIHVTPSTTYSP